MNELGEDLLTPAIRITAISAAQAIVFILMYEAAAEIYRREFGGADRIFGFGMQMNFSVYLLSILAGVNSLANVLFERLEHRLITAITCPAVWIVFWGNIAIVAPRRFGLISVLGMLSFLLGVLFNTPAKARRLA